MSAAAAPAVRTAPSGPSLRARIAAVAVVVALAALAYYAVFAGPTTVPLKTPTKAAGGSAAPAVPQGEPKSGAEPGD